LGVNVLAGPEVGVFKIHMEMPKRPSSDYSSAYCYGNDLAFLKATLTYIYNTAFKALNK
jgi:hypothetical protein